MNPKITVSIAMCTFNGENYLSEQLESICRQTCLPDEIVICDDASTDPTVEILRSWKKTVTFPVEIISNQSNLGYARNFMQAINHCRGNIIFLSDQDDIWQPEKIERMKNEMVCNPNAGIVYCNALMVDNNGSTLNIDHTSVSKEYVRCFLPFFLSISNCAPPVTSGCCCAVQKELFNLFPPLESEWPHDLWIYLFSQLFSTPVYLNEKLIWCRIHKSNASRLDVSPSYLDQCQLRVRQFYQKSPGTYLFLQSKIDKFQEIVELLPSSNKRSTILKKLANHRKHYTNRERIQRNAMVFFPLWILEIIAGRYFMYPHPILSMFYDLRRGLFHK